MKLRLPPCETRFLIALNVGDATIERDCTPNAPPVVGSVPVCWPFASVPLFGDALKSETPVLGTSAVALRTSFAGPPVGSTYVSAVTIASGLNVSVPAPVVRSTIVASGLYGGGVMNAPCATRELDSMALRS